LLITSERIGDVPGTHEVFYKSEVDDITIRHEAHNRKGFATGAVLAAEFMNGKKGIFGMEDLLNIS
jgi:4-hydroxy-tetrahydrodipicolinate reductase